MKIGIDLGGSHIGVGLIEGYDLKDTVDKFFSQEDKLNIEEAILNNTYELVEKLLNQNSISISDIEKIGVASPGTVSDGKITAWNLGLKEFDFERKLVEKYGLPVPAPKITTRPFSM